jgi:hypothetical protein
MRTKAGFILKVMSAGFFLGMGGCALFSVEAPPEKNANIKFTNPQEPFRKIDESTADSIWQSMKTGNTIAINSSCTKDEGSIKKMEDSILSGVENLKSRKTQKIQIDDVGADRIHAEGTTDGIKVAIDLVEMRKGDCMYDLAYVARLSSFAEEIDLFDQFLKGFHAP